MLPLFKTQPAAQQPFTPSVSTHIKPQYKVSIDGAILTILRDRLSKAILERTKYPDASPIVIKHFKDEAGYMRYLNMKAIFALNRAENLTVPELLMVDKMLQLRLPNEGGVFVGTESELDQLCSFVENEFDYIQLKPYAFSAYKNGQERVPVETIQLEFVRIVDTINELVPYIPSAKQPKRWLRGFFNVLGAKR